jgi:carbon monoxide dehydrogenase subunit G
MRIEEEFEVEAPPEAVYDLVTDPERLPEWQPTTKAVRREREGPLQPGERFVEVHRAMGRDMESVVEAAELDRPRAFALHIVEGAVPLDGRWTFEATGAGTRVLFVGEGDIRGPMKLARPLLARQFRGYHRKLKELAEAG